MSAPATHSYYPGVCNIGPAERRMRRLSGIAGVVMTIALLVTLVVIDAGWAWRLLLVFPATLATVGLLQDRLHFCAAFGLKGIFNVINSAGVTDQVELEAFRQKDRRKAIAILLWSVATGVVMTALSLLI